MSDDITRLKQKDVEGFQVADGMGCADKMVYAGGVMSVLGVYLGALQAAIPRIWPKNHYGPTLLTPFSLMAKHSVTLGA